MLEDHRLRFRREISHFNGVEVDNAGDGFFVRFDSPAYAIKAARAATSAVAGQVLVSSTVRELAGGAGFQFSDLGDRELKGVPDRWRLYSVGD